MPEATNLNHSLLHRSTHLKDLRTKKLYRLFYTLLCAAAITSLVWSFITQALTSVANSQSNPGEPSTSAQLFKLIVEYSVQKLPNPSVTFPQMNNQALGRDGDRLTYLASIYKRDILVTFTKLIRE